MKNVLLDYVFVSLVPLETVGISEMIAVCSCASHCINSHAPYENVCVTPRATLHFRAARVHGSRAPFRCKDWC
jgi:hypothetical protein